MTTPINKVLTNQIQNLSNEELANVSASLSAILGQGGGGEPCASAWRPTVDDIGIISWTLTTSTTTPAPVKIMGPQGQQGPSGTNGKDAPIPEFQINSSNAHWEWKYTSASNWTDLNVVASGTVGPQGIQGPSGAKGDTGAKGADATPLTADTTTIAGGTQVTISYTSGGDPLAQFNVLSGAQGASGQKGQDGAPGIDGISPTFTTSVTSDAQHPQGGTHVVLSGAAGESAFNVWNGVDGEGATVDLLEGNGIQITHEAGTTNYTIGVSADYLQSVSVAADGSLAGSGTTNSPLALKTSAENAIKTVSSKSNVDITSAGVTTVTNTSGTTINKFTQYGEVDYHPTPKMFLCATADSQADIVSVLGAASGMGAVVFVVQSI